MTVDELKAHLRAWDDKLKAECPDAKADKKKPQCATRLVIEQALALKDMQKLRNYVHRIFVHEMKAFADNTMKHDLAHWPACGPRVCIANAVQHMAIMASRTAITASRTAIAASLTAIAASRAAIAAS